MPPNDQRNNDAPPPWSFIHPPPESTAHRLTRTAREPDAAGFGAFRFGFLDILRILLFPLTRIYIKMQKRAVVAKSCAPPAKGHVVRAELKIT
jgi:hypothetical protein